MIQYVYLCQTKINCTCSEITKLNFVYLARLFNSIFYPNIK